VTVLTLVGYTLGAHTAQMSYSELVFAGKDMIGPHLRWLIPALLLGFAGYVYVSKKIMAPSTAPASQNEIDG
jgi:hypothetical protein